MSYVKNAKPKITTLQIAMITSLCKRHKMPRPKSFPELYEQAEKLIQSLTPKNDV